MSEAPPVTIELLAPMPPLGHQWCAICALLYLGEASSDINVQRNAQKHVEEAIAAGVKEVNILVPESWRKLRIAVTTAPTVYFPNVPMPTCWIHLQGMSPDSRQAEIIQVNVNGHVK